MFAIHSSLTILRMQFPHRVVLIFRKSKIGIAYGPNRRTKKQHMKILLWLMSQMASKTKSPYLKKHLGKFKCLVSSSDSYIHQLMML